MVPAVAPRATAAAEPRITVEAGAMDRQATPVSFALPAGVAGARPLELRPVKGGGKAIPLQVKDGQGLFVLPVLGRGKTLQLRVEEAQGTAAPSSIQVEKKDEHLVISIAGSPVLHFRTRAPAPTAEVPARYTRAGYLHPVFTPGGVLVTDDSPRDHGHHHGIWTAWTVTEYEGKRLSFWGPEPGRSKNDLVSLGEPWSGPVAAGFSAKLASSDDSVKPPRQILDSEWKVVVHRTHERKPPYFLFDLDWTDKVVGDKPLRLPEYRYGGLGVRGHRDWIEQTAVTFLTSEGKDRLAGENTRARWVHLGGPVGHKAAGLAVLIHPANIRAPEPVRLNPGIPLLCVAPPKAGPMAIDPGQPYNARYRFVVSDGPANPALLERLWRDWARPPTVKVDTPATASLKE